MKQIHAGMAAQAAGVIVVSMDGENRQSHVHIWVLFKTNKNDKIRKGHKEEKNSLMQKAEQHRTKN